VPWCLHEKIEAGYTEVPRTNRRKKAAQAWTLKGRQGGTLRRRQVVMRRKTPAATASGTQPPTRAMIRH